MAPEFDAALELSKQFVMKAESTAGADVLGGSYLAADIVEADARSIRETNDPNEIENLIVKGNLGRAPALKGPRVTRVDCRVPIRGLLAGASEYDDSPELVPTADRPLRGCRLGRTFANPGAADSSVKYAPTSSGETFTIYVPILVSGTSALVRKYTGCQGTFRAVGLAGEGMAYEFSFIGSFLEEADITFVPGALTLAPQFPSLVDAEFQIGSGNYAPRIRNVVFDAGQRVGRLPSINAATGVAGFKVVDRAPSLSIDPEIALEATSGWWAAFKDGVPLKDCTFKLGSTHTNRLRFQFAGDGSTGNLQVVDHQRDTRDDVACFRMLLRPTIPSANGDWSLLYD
jgi:hypothetical protein